MNGVLFTIDKLGIALAQAEQEVAALRARVAELEAEKAERDSRTSEPPAAS